MRKLAAWAPGLMILILGATSGNAHEMLKVQPRPKHAIHELNEAKEVIAKLKPDAEGHIARASQSIDQAIAELSAVKESVKKV